MSAVHAGPEGGVIRGGSGSISKSDLATLIQQNSDLLAIDWDSFDIGADERVDFIQPGLESIALNRVLSNNPSEIFGQINANGNVILANPHGIHFGSGASVNVGGLIAAGMDINPDDFMNRDFTFSALEGADGKVINRGLIHAATGGSVGLLGKQVENDGLIVANLGTVQMAGGTEAVATFDENGMLGVKVSKEVLQEELGIDPAVLNSGEIRAHGGKVVMSASVSRDLFSGAVNTGDMKQATSAVVHEDGSFTLTAGGADTVNTGEVDVSSPETGGDAGQVVMVGENVTSSGDILADAENGNGGDIELHSVDTTKVTGDGRISARSESGSQGGQIKLLGDKVGLFDQATVDASGSGRGGDILIGGGREGLNERIRNAEFTYLGEGSAVKADGLGTGDGGRVIAFASDTARIHGDMAARGGASGGNGGFIETSGKINFEILKSPDTSASYGIGGEWLIDPYSIDIISGDGNTGINNENPFESSADGASLGVGLITDALTGEATVTITTGAGGDAENGDITFRTDLDFDEKGSNTLILNASKNINISGNNIWDSNVSSGTDSLNIEFHAGSNINIIDSRIYTRGGYFTASGVGFTSIRGGNSALNIRTSGGDVSLNMTGNVDIGAEIITSGGDILVGTRDEVDPALVDGVGSFTNDSGRGRLDVSSPGGGGNIDIYTDVIDGSSGNAVLGELDVSDSELGNGVDGGGAILVNSGADITLAREYDFDGTGALDGDGNPVAASFKLVADNNIALNAATIDNDTGNGSDLLNIDLTANNDASDGGNVTVAASIATAGGRFDSESAAFDSTGGVVDSSGADNIDGGIIRIETTGTGNIETGVLTADGGAANRDGGTGVPGRNAGNITLDAGGSVTTASAISAAGTTGDFSGGDLSGQPGGNGANITITADSSIQIQDVVDADGGAGAGQDDTNPNNSDPGDGGDAGDITLTADSITVDAILSAAGGDGVGREDADSDIPAAIGGDGGLIELNGSTVALNADLDSRGGAAVHDEGGSGELPSPGTDGQVNVNVVGADGRVTLGHTSDFSSTVNVRGDGTVAGQTLRGPDRGMEWTIDADGGGALTATAGGSAEDNVTFSGLEDLVGGSADDTFVIAEGGSIGSIDGNSETDPTDTNTLERTNTAGDNAWALTDAFTGTLDTTPGDTNDPLIGFENIQELVGGGGADTLTGRNQANAWEIDATGGGTVAEDVGSPSDSVAFSNMEELVGNADTDVFNLQEGGVIGGTIDGAGGSDELQRSNTGGNNAWILDDASAFAGTLNGNAFESIETLTGSDEAGVTNTLTGRDQANEWQIDSAGGGTVAEDVGSPADRVAFSNMDNLVGNSDADTFDLQQGGVIAGTIDGAGGSDELQRSNTSGSNAWVLDDALAFAGTLNGSAFESIETLTGSDEAGVADTLTGRDQANEWQIDSTGGGTVAEDVGSPADSVTFSNMDNLVGNSDADTFDLQQDGVITGTIDGAGGSDELQRSNTGGDNAWILDDASAFAGTLNGNAFESIETLTGSDEAGVTDTLTGRDQANEWQIDSAGGGTVAEDADSPADSVAFSDMENLVGNTQADIFDVQPGGFIAGAIDGGGGSNVLQRTNTAGANAWALADADAFSGTLDATPGDTTDPLIGFENIQELVGGGGIDTLTGRDQANEWQIDTTGGGTVAEDIGSPTDSVAFSSMENLFGNTEADTFDLQQGGVITGTIDGAGGSDELQRSNTGGDNTWVLDDGQAFAGTLNGDAFESIETLTGSDETGVTDTLTGRNQANTWTIDGAAGGAVGETGAGSDTVTFAEMDVLAGNDGVDTFDNSTATVAFEGAWNGGAGDDVFTIEQGVTGGVSGGSGADRFEMASVVAVDVDGGADIDTLAFAGGNNTWDITGENEGEVSLTDNSTSDVTEFQSIEHLEGGDGDDVYQFDDSNNAAITGSIDAGDEIDGDEVDYSEQSTVDVEIGSAFNGVSNAEIIRGKDVNSTLTGSANGDTWTIDGNNDGEVANEDEQVRFINFNNLIGGAGDDTFTVATGGHVTGWLSGGGGDDTLDVSAVDNAEVAIIDSLADASPTDPLLQAGDFETLTADSADPGTEPGDSLIGLDAPTTWTFDTTNQLVYTDGDNNQVTVTFSGFDQLQGGDRDDTFQFTDAATSFTGTIDAGGHDTDSGDKVDYSELSTVDVEIGSAFNGVSNAEIIEGKDNGDSTLTGSAEGDTWTINGENEGRVVNGDDDVRFINFNNLIGGAGDDTFDFEPNGGLTGLLDGGGHGGSGDTVDLENVNRDMTVAVGTENSADLNIARVETLNANTSATNTLEGNNTDGNSWDIDGTDRGELNGMTFIGFANMLGGDQTDTFTLDDNDTITGWIDGGGGDDDTLDLTGLDDDVSVALGTDVGADLNVLDLDQVDAATGNDDDRLLGDNTETSWAITSANAGTVEGMDFTGFDALQGGDADDTFQVQTTADLEMSIDGGDEVDVDTVDYSSQTGEITATLGTAFNGIDDAEHVKGNNTNSTLSAGDTPNTWTIDGANDGQVAGVEFSGFNFLVGGDARDVFNVEDGGTVSGHINAGAGNDELNVALSTGADGAVTFNGQGGGDMVNLTGGGAGFDGVYTPGSADERLVYTRNADTYEVIFTGVDSVQDDANAGSLTVNGTSGADDITLGNATFEVDGHTTVGYTNKTDLIVAGGGADDSLRVAGNVNATGTVTFDVETIADGGGRVNANRLVLDNPASAGTAGARLQTDVNQLRVVDATGAVYIDQAGALALLRSETDARLDIRAGGTVNGDSALVIGGPLALQSGGDIRLTALTNRFTGRVDLDANGAIAFENSLDTTFGAVSAASLTAVSGGTLTGEGPMQIDNTTDLTADGAITLEHADNDFDNFTVDNATGVTVVDRDALNVDDVRAAGTAALEAGDELTLSGNIEVNDLEARAGGAIDQNTDLTAPGTITLDSGAGITMNTGTRSEAETVAYTAAGDIDTTELQAGDTLSLTSTGGALIDTNGRATNLTAARVVLDSRRGIGGDDSAAMDLAADELDAVNGSGAVFINSTGRLNVDRLHNRGDIELFNNGGLDVSSASIDAGHDTGSIFMSVAGGNVLGLGRVPDLRTEPADITGLNGTFLVPTGTFGSPGRPITLNIQDTLFVSALTAFTPLFPPGGRPNRIVDESIATVSSVEAVTALTGSQLIEVESVSEIDPAVFTDIHNFNYPEIAIQLPPDQLYEEEYREYRRKRGLPVEDEDEAY